MTLPENGRKLGSRSIGLLIASVTAWFQFAPTADRIQLVSEGRITTGHPIEVLPVGGLDVHTFKPLPVIGPVSWKIRITNNTDKVVSIVSFKVFQLNDDGEEFYNSSTSERLSIQDASLEAQRLPDNIGANETKGYLVSLMMPIIPYEEERNRCIQNVDNLKEIEQCFYVLGRDLFGNDVEATFDESTPPKIIHVSWQSRKQQPKFRIDIEKADGSMFTSDLSYFPF